MSKTAQSINFMRILMPIVIAVVVLFGFMRSGITADSLSLGGALGGSSSSSSKSTKKAGVAKHNAATEQKTAIKSLEQESEDLREQEQELMKKLAGGAMDSGDPLRQAPLQIANVPNDPMTRVVAERDEPLREIEESFEPPVRMEAIKAPELPKQVARAPQAVAPKGAEQQASRASAARALTVEQEKEKSDFIKLQQEITALRQELAVLKAAPAPATAVPVEARARATMPRLIESVSEVQEATFAKPDVSYREVAIPSDSSLYPTAIVLHDNVGLWSGPGKDSSLIMTVDKNTPLSIESRVGAWYRVVTDSGMRSWIHGSLVAFKPNLRTLPSTEWDETALRVRGMNMQ